LAFAAASSASFLDLASDASAALASLAFYSASFYS